MKKVLIPAILAVLAISYCSYGDARRDATTVGSDGWVFEGWACAPDAAKALEGLSPAQYCTDDDNKDYLYLKFSARASNQAIQNGSIAMKQTTCRRAARDLVAGDGLSKIIGDYLEQASGVADGQSTGYAIVTQSRGKIKGIGLYDCCSLDSRSGTCVEAGGNETWEDCQCVGYLKFPGGQRAFEAAAEEAQINQ
ncbi:MAG: lipoprotein LipL21 [Leptospiraceae bacterium]|nr:lipoprotein LipL21 [Leptospiraceae bacterium]MCB1303528.1 lipoprotein LipL21 [Leptospiraceae bacterium]